MNLGKIKNHSAPKIKSSISQLGSRRTTPSNSHKWTRPPRSLARNCHPISETNTSTSQHPVDCKRCSNPTLGLASASSRTALPPRHGSSSCLSETPPCPALRRPTPNRSSPRSSSRKRKSEQLHKPKQLHPMGKIHREHALLYGNLETVG